VHHVLLYALLLVHFKTILHFSFESIGELSEIDQFKLLLSSIKTRANKYLNTHTSQNNLTFQMNLFYRDPALSVIGYSIIQLKSQNSFRIA